MKVRYPVLAGMLGLAAPAFASVCDEQQMMASNLLILSNLPPLQGRVTAFEVSEKGTDSDGYHTLRYQFDRCGALSGGSSVFYRDYGATQMRARAVLERSNNGWQAGESMAVKVQGARLTHGSSDIRYERDEHGRIVHRFEQFVIEDSPGESHTAYHFDSRNRLTRAQTTSTHSFFDETREFAYGKGGRLVQVSSAKGSWQLTWHEDGRWLSGERKVNHPYSVQVTVHVCEKWDERNNCVQGTVSETEQYPRQSLQTHYVFTQNVQYD
ncbi:hypothetical protein GWD52_12295 [Enterobacteriaceae bacterium 4M9]|nr:hypothetical protein [Enterobacteriaceae bacterium 4M9]